jgi:voltage-gated potassium channel
LLLVVVLFSGSIAVLNFESAADEGNIRTAADALWWAITTVTTVGYGDLYPVTIEGRLVAVVLMVTGVGTFATLAGALATWFMESQPKSAD